ncbi:hypothetical protein L3X38_020023 [Prunus dulcis]|uniref:Protein kinase domain-containing protein n=1 Tax=Prunus dulcis TaxID=3755 RepID=A0AAD4ZCJ6_PRUDU|nr:hypothetical protein L3X38_020023 [Prunus dulcis]
MMKPILSTYLYFSLFMHMIVVTIFVAGNSPPIYKPVEDITVNCGSSGTIFNDHDQRTWTGDIYSKFSPLEPQAVGNTSIFKEAPHSYTVLQVPYTTARLSHFEFTYRFFNLTPGQKFVRLYFYPASYPDFDPSKAFFSVKAGGFTLLHDFNASVTAAASGLEETVYREFCMNIEEEEEPSLSITFTPSRAIQDAYAFINGIEIVSMPVNLYYTPRGIQYVGTENIFRIENNTALEAVYRINVGGSELFFDKDTGMYRNWNAYGDEQIHLEELSLDRSVLPQNDSIQLHFAKIPEYSAPKEVYQTARAMGNDTAINKSYNLTWQFPVDSNFNYLVRLHFCEFQAGIWEIGDQVFLIYLHNIPAETTADIIEWSGGNGFPIYRDYLVSMQLPSSTGTGSKAKVNLTIALQANPHDWRTLISDAMLNGLEIFKLNNSEGNLAGPNPDPPPMDPTNTTSSSGPEKPKLRNTHLLAIVAGVVPTTIALLSVLWLFLGFRRRQKLKDYGGGSTRGATNSTKSRGSSLPSNLCHYFSLAEIKDATRNFSEICIIGRGGFGNVYKGYLDGAATPVAIKRLKPESSQGAHEFKTEIEMLSHLRHRHLVSLIGYCADEGEMILVYDMMDRGALSDYLYHKDNPSLPWEQRLEICIGAARGLHYLHTSAQYTIIHRDVKSTNILLDEKWVAKVSDFGLSKMGTTSMSKTHISTMVKGSFGYLDPEYYRRNQLTEKSDVYSFGVVLCEVLCGRPAFLRTAGKKQMSLAEWAKSCHREGTLDQIIDPSLKGKIGKACLNKFVEMAISCIHDNGIQRPSMNDVVWGLEYALQLHQKAERDLDFKGEDEVALMNDNDAAPAGFSTSCCWEEEETSNSLNSSGLTKLSSSDQNSTTNESIKGMSRIVFSGINDTDGR